LTKLIKERSEYCPEFDYEPQEEITEMMIRGRSTQTEPMWRRKRRKESISSLLFN